MNMSNPNPTNSIHTSHYKERLNSTMLYDNGPISIPGFTGMFSNGTLFRFGKRVNFNGS